MPLSDVLGRIPGIAGYEASRQLREQQEAQGLQQQMLLQKLLMGKQAQEQDIAFKEKSLAQQAADRAAAREATAAQRDATLAFQNEALAARTAEAQAARQARMDELRLKLSDARLAGQDRMAMQRELAQLTATTQRDIAQMRADAQKELAGMKAETSPAAIKEREKTEARQSTTSLLDELEADYGQLQKLGADVSPKRGAVQNVANWAAGTRLGQTVTGAVGTEAQAVRDSIAQKRASLMASIKQATGIGASQLNSNVELQFYLKMATDPTMAREANLKAIKWLRDTYGIKGGAPASGLSPDEQKELDALRSRFGKR
jgi:hypothetical protein